MSACDCAVIATTCPTIPRRYSPYCRLVDVSSANPQVYFSVAPYINSNQTIIFNHDSVYLELRRKGSERLLGTYNVWRRDLTGAIGFYFDGNLFDQSPGYFVGDVYINCEYCFSVQLRLRPCGATVLSCYTQPVLETCGGGECSVIQVIGIGSIGGVGCATTADCGGIAPYFPLDNPVTPAQEQINQCCPSSVMGLGTIG